MNANTPVTASADAPPPRPSPACRDGLDAETMRAMAAMAITARPDATRGEADVTAATASVASRARRVVDGATMRTLEAEMAKLKGPGAVLEQEVREVEEAMARL